MCCTLSSQSCGTKLRFPVIRLNLRNYIPLTVKNPCRHFTMTYLNKVIFYSVNIPTKKNKFQFQSIVDRGSPLACRSNDRWYLIGLKSWTRNCEESFTHDIYTDVTHFTPWIQVSRVRWTASYPIHVRNSYNYSLSKNLCLVDLLFYSPNMHTGIIFNFEFNLISNIFR